MKKNYILINLLFFIAFTLNAQEVYFPPNGEWQEKQASNYHLDFNEAVEFAKKNEYSESRDLRQAILKGFQSEPYHKLLGPTKRRGGPAGVILKNGYIVAKWGDIERVDMTFSVTKSFLSTTALIAKQEDLIDSFDDKVENYLWDGTFDGPHNSKITWEHLLQQNSDWSGELWDSFDWADRPPQDQNIDQWRSRELHEPGTYFKYNDVRVNVLAYSLLNVFREPLPKILKKNIMDPIGASTTWRWYGYENSWTTIDGLKMQSVSGGGHSGGGMFISTKDMARFGLLFMKWKNEQLLSSELIHQAVQSSSANPDYGYMWWLNKDASMKNLGQDVFYAAGFGGNFIVVDQKNNLVIVIRWLEPSKFEEFLNLVYKNT
ncbi:serine hydrolase [Christiangramia fulva]|uniref:Serine hydrolase n=1 Tax=Christiangramia fulva TaxID=2126553 RepID=A0A2R3Z8X4_9FLAO|nr:serine hydrolase [Christiangramia fulva]AVR46664.1 serine hydrolase [Christiangramia fulva]